MNDLPTDPDLSPAGWEQRYEDKKTGWDRREPSPALLGWLENGQLQQGRVLIPGCGAGHEVVELARRGFQVTAIDFAESAVRTVNVCLEDEGLTAEVHRADVLEFKTETAFDAIYEQTCLCALAPENWPAYERQLYSWLGVGGHLFAAFMQTASTGGPPFHCDLRLMRELFRSEDWVWPDQQSTINHPSGLKEITLVLTRNA